MRGDTVNLSLGLYLRSAGKSGPPAPNLRPKNTIPPSITGTPVVEGNGTINPGAWTGADTITWTLTANGVTYDDASPFFVWDAAWEGYRALLTITATNQYGSTKAYYMSDAVQPASSPFWAGGVFGGPSGTAIFQFDKWGE